MTTLLTEPAAPAAPPAAVVAAAEPAAAAAPAVTGDGAGRWTVPEDMRTNDSLRKFMDDKFTIDPATVTKSYVNLESTLGRDKIAIPKSEEDWGKAWDALGRPANAEAYEVKKPEMPEGMKYDDEGEKFLRNFAHQNGWNQKQFANAYDAYFKQTMEQQQGWAKTLSDQRETVTADLKREWGDAYDANVALAKAGFLEFSTPEFAEFLEQSGQGNDPRMVKVFAKIGKELMGESKLKGGEAGSGAMTPAEVAAKIKSFRETNHAALFDAAHPDHKRLVAELEGLHKVAAPQPKR